jgi:hypothetical protein
MEIIIKFEKDELKDLFGLHDDKTREKCKPDISPYAQFFDEQCIGWSKDPEMNKLFLLQQQNYANDKLVWKGHLFLNEVYDILGLPRTKAGQYIGWIYDVHNPVGDNYVDFGLYHDCNRNFIDGKDNAILLNFNVDGNILDRF